MQAHITRGTSTRITAVIAGVLALVASLLMASPTAQAQNNRPAVGGGTPILLGGAACTVTAAGFDRAGRAVAFTAGHCSQGLNQTVMLAEYGPIGRVVARNEVLDYTVIELDTNRVTPVRQAGVADRGPAPRTGDVACKLGASTGYACGITWEVRDNVIHSQVCAGPGDSGAPIMVGDRLVGMLNGGQMPPTSSDLGFGSLGAVLPPCLHPIQSPLFLPAYGFVFDAQVADATARNWPGADFRMA